MELVKEGEPGYRIYVKEGVPLNRSDNEAYQSIGVTDKKRKGSQKERSGY